MSLLRTTVVEKLFQIILYGNIYIFLVVPCSNEETWYIPVCCLESMTSDLPLLEPIVVIPANLPAKTKEDHFDRLEMIIAHSSSLNSFIIDASVDLFFLHLALIIIIINASDATDPCNCCNPHFVLRSNRWNLSTGQSLVCFTVVKPFCRSISLLV